MKSGPRHFEVSQQAFIHWCLLPDLCYQGMQSGDFDRPNSIIFSTLLVIIFYKEQLWSAFFFLSSAILSYSTYWEGRINASYRLPVSRKWSLVTSSFVQWLVDFLGFLYLFKKIITNSLFLFTLSIPLKRQNYTEVQQCQLCALERSTGRD